MTYYVGICPHCKPGPVGIRPNHDRCMGDDCTCVCRPRCPVCRKRTSVTGEPHEETTGPDGYIVTVTDLDCGHEMVRETGRRDWV